MPTVTDRHRLPPAAGAGRGRDTTAQLQRLLSKALAPSTAYSYRAALDAFEVWLEVERLPPVGALRFIPDELDHYAAEYIAACWSKDRTKGKTKARNVPYALRAAFPGIARLPTAERAAKAWHRDFPSVRYPPMSQEVMAAVALRMALNGHWLSAAQAVISFHCMNRVNECAQLLREHVFLGDMAGGRVAAFGAKYGFRIPRAKGVDEAFCEVHDPNAKAMLQIACEGVPNGAHVFPNASAFRRHLSEACAQLGLSDKYVPHSLRHGGATHRHLMGQQMQDIQLAGRWAVARSTERYIQPGRNLLLDAKADDTVLRTGRDAAPRIAAWIIAAAEFHQNKVDAAAASRLVRTTPHAVKARQQQRQR